MNKKIYPAIVLLSLASPSYIFAAEDTAAIHGSIELGGVGVNTNGDKARFQEFRDLDSSIVGNVELEYLKGTYHFQFDADKPGLDDQSYQLKGGKYGDYKYKFNYSELPHNYTFDAITPYTGLGTNTITIVAAPADTTTWTKFDYAVDHKSYGGELEISLGSPFYVNLGAEKREQDGFRPYSVVINHSNGSRSFAEVPEPISYTTDNLHLKAGYLGNSVSASLAGSWSSFDNDIKYFYRAGGVADTDIDRTNVLAPDNDYRKIAGDITWRDLPSSSVLAARLSHANLQNDFAAADIGYSAAMLATLASLNRTTFEGDIDYTNASIALSSRPTDKMDTKIYYTYIERDNNSSVISYGVATAATNNAKELLSYEKNTFGIDLGYRLPYKTKLDAGYEYLNTDRSTALPAYSAAGNFYRYDNPESTTDHSGFLSLKNSVIDWLTTKIKYTRLNRDNDFDTSAVLAAGFNPNIYTTRFDAAGKIMNEWKLAIELYPTNNLDFGLDVTHQHNDYDWNNSSRNDDKRQSVYADVTWRATKTFSLNGFVGFEATKIDANKRTSLGLTPVRVESTDDEFWSYGLSANIEATDKLAFNLSWQHDESDGSVDFTSLTGTTYTNITEFDDYTRKRLDAKAIYAIAPKLKMTIGYLYEQLKYSDYAYNTSYANVVAMAGQGTAYLSGLYANPNYEANVGYLMVSYGF